MPTADATGIDFATGEANCLEVAMVRHKYAVGEQVEFLPGRNDLHVPPGIYTIVRQLPIEANDCQYRVKNARDGHERIMRESQLSGSSTHRDRMSPAKLRQ